MSVYEFEMQRDWGSRCGKEKRMDVEKIMKVEGERRKIEDIKNEEKRGEDFSEWSKIINVTFICLVNVRICYNFQ